jgi:hypothetical protein
MMAEASVAWGMHFSLNVGRLNDQFNALKSSRLMTLGASTVY